MAATPAYKAAFAKKQSRWMTSPAAVEERCPLEACGNDELERAKAPMWAVRGAMCARCRIGIAQRAMQNYAGGMRDSSPDIEAARRAGIDLHLIDENLRLSLEQRALQHQDALNLALEVERAGRQLRERSAKTPAAAG